MTKTIDQQNASDLEGNQFQAAEQATENPDDRTSNCGVAALAADETDVCF